MADGVAPRQRGLILAWTMLGLSVAAGLLLAYIGRPGAAGGFAFAPGLQTFQARSAEDLATRLDAAGLTKAVNGRTPQAVARFGLRRIPADWPGIKDSDHRKTLFIASVLPLVLSANDAILEDRKRLLQLRQKKAGFSASEKKWLSGLARRYRTEADDLDRLLIRVDTIPPSLALAQAAIESGWGTSRFARQGNALFGQWTWAKDAGMKPKRMRDGLGEYAIKRYDSLYASVADYMRNLNTQKAYAGFRRQRASLRAQGKWPNGAAIAATLRRYSEEGETYVRKLTTLIRTNRLALLDGARLAR